MKKAVDLQGLGKAVDFDDVGKRLDALTAAGKLKRSRYAHLLDRVQPQLVNARKNGVTLMELKKFLNESGIPVSEPTLRNYLAPLFVKKRRQGQSKKQSEVEAVPLTALPEEVPAGEASSSTGAHLHFVDEEPTDGNPSQKPAKSRGRPRKTITPKASVSEAAEAHAHLEKMKGDAARKRQALFGEPSPSSGKK